MTENCRISKPHWNPAHKFEMTKPSMRLVCRHATLNMHVLSPFLARRCKLGWDRQNESLLGRLDTWGLVFIAGMALFTSFGREGRLLHNRKSNTFYCCWKLVNFITRQKDMMTNNPINILFNFVLLVLSMKFNTYILSLLQFTEKICTSHANW